LVKYIGIALDINSGIITKKEGEMISGVENLDVRYIYSIGIAKIFLR
jgi:hypothetical protein